MGPAVLLGHSPRFPGWAHTPRQEHQPLGGSSRAEAKTLCFPADQLHPAGPGCPQPQLSPGFQWGQPRLLAAASGTATAGGKRWIVLPRVPGTSPEMAVEVCLQVLSPCSQFRGSHTPHPAPPLCHGAPVPVRVALGWGVAPRHSLQLLRLLGTIDIWVNKQAHLFRAFLAVTCPKTAG